jgi:integral membrane protein (TIGR01906 family)
MIMNAINNKKEVFAAAICGLLILFIMLLTAVETLCFRIPGWWRSEYTKYNTPQYVRGEMSMDDAVYVTEQMLDYCVGRIDSLDDVQATIDGIKAPFFTDREKLHLADCRKLFMAAYKARTISVILLAVLLIAIYLSLANKKRDGSITGSAQSMPFRCVLAKGYLYALAVVAAFSAVIAVISFIDFTYVFTVFHHIFFDNDLWILYPEEDNLINIMQEAVFADAALTIAAMWLSAAAALAVISIVIIRRYAADQSPADSGLN